MKQYKSIRIITIFFIFDRNGQADAKVHNEMQSTWIVKFLKNKVRTYSWYQTLCGKTMKIKLCDMASRQTYRSMEQNWEYKNKPIHLWSIDFQQGYQDH